MWWLWQMQDIDSRLNAVPMVGVVHPHEMDTREKRQEGRITDPLKMVVDLEWLSPVTTKLMEAHDQLGANGGLYCYVYI